MRHSSHGEKRAPYLADPRGIAKNAEKFVKENGYDISYWGPEVEFFVFDKLQVNTLTSFHSQSHEITLGSTMVNRKCWIYS